MSEVLLIRIDNRLIHGQVATQWIGDLGANTVIVANDDVANDEFRQSLMNMAAPAKAKTVYATLEGTKEIVDNAGDDDTIFILTETPADALKLIELGVPAAAVNVGNMHMAEGKRQVATTVAVDDKDVEDLKAIQDKGIELFVKRTPGVEEEDLDVVLA